MERNLILISLLCSLIGLFLIYYSTLIIQPVEVDLNNINFELIGRVVKTRGKIVYKREHEAGHLFLTLAKDDTKIQVPIFAGLMEKLKEVGINSEDFKKGKEIIVTGLVDEYGGQLQIIPRKVEDLVIV